MLFNVFIQASGGHPGQPRPHPRLLHHSRGPQLDRHRRHRLHRLGELSRPAARPVGGACPGDSAAGPADRLLHPVRVARSGIGLILFLIPGVILGGRPDAGVPGAGAGEHRDADERAAPLVGAHPGIAAADVRAAGDARRAALHAGGRPQRGGEPDLVGRRADRAAMSGIGGRRSRRRWCSFWSIRCSTAYSPWPTTTSGCGRKASTSRCSPRPFSPPDAGPRSAGAARGPGQRLRDAALPVGRRARPPPNCCATGGTVWATGWSACAPRTRRRSACWCSALLLALLLIFAHAVYVVWRTGTGGRPARRAGAASVAREPRRRLVFPRRRSRRRGGAAGRRRSSSRSSRSTLTLHGQRVVDFHASKTPAEYAREARLGRGRSRAAPRTGTGALRPRVRRAAAGARGIPALA